MPQRCQQVSQLEVKYSLISKRLPGFCHLHPCFFILQVMKSWARHGSKAMLCVPANCMINLLCLVASDILSMI